MQPPFDCHFKIFKRKFLKLYWVSSDDIVCGTNGIVSFCFNLHHICIAHKSNICEATHYFFVSIL